MRDDDGVTDTPRSATSHARVTDEPLSVDDLLGAVRHPGAGAVVLFVGTVRDHDEGRPGVVELGYSAHPDAAARLQDIVGKVAGRPGLRAVAAEHRTGSLAVGDVAVVCAVAGDHRAEAFEACRDLIEELKETVPIWKRQAFQDGDAQWVGL
jgi:molybdopterin synthase catalytic subunit